MGYKTCADCKYHACATTCVQRGLCSGYCKKKVNHRRCYSSRCSDFKLDEFFLLEEEEGNYGKRI